MFKRIRQALKGDNVAAAIFCYCVLNTYLKFLTTQPGIFTTLFCSRRHMHASEIDFPLPRRPGVIKNVAKKHCYRRR